MNKSFFKLISQIAIGTAVIVMLLSNILIAHDVQAQYPVIDAQGNLIKAEHLNLAQQEALRAEWLRQKEQIMQSWEWRIKLAFVGGVLNALNYVTQKFAHDAAEMILTGGESGVPLFHTDQWGDYLANTADGAVAHIIDSMDTFVGDYTEENLGQRLSLCHKPDALAISLSIGLGEMGQPGPGQCTISNMVRNFGAVADMVESGDAIQMHKVQFTPTGNDLHAGLSVNNMVIQDVINKKEAALMDRLENKGMSPIIDHISGKIKYPSELANEALKKTEPTGMLLDTEKEQRAYMMEAYWSAGIEAIWYTAISTFANTLVFGILQRIFAEGGPSGTSTKSRDAMVVQYEVLTNQDAAGEAQDLYERREFAKALGDYITPNFGSFDERDLVTELMTCTTPRTRWNCAMDQAFAVSLNVGTTDGALTVGRASGVGSEGASFKSSAQGLHPDWELIPESDIKNNTDPSCATRAYCAGNLKKLRLARIIPIGWEMAANSPFNIKKSGKYITLGDVIRGFYDCNDQGELDKDHPWCHLIDPNWILAAPKYMCRTTGYGDTLIPDIGTRLEECGDVASCLGTDQNNECTKGYGYCLAEKPVYRFEARSCDEQFASCRTYNYSGGQLSALRFTIDQGNCSADNIGCMWYSTERYVSSTYGVNPTPDGLWVGTATTGPRLYADKDVQPCTEEGCTKMLRVDIGSPALNLIQNGSFEDIKDRVQNNQTTILGLDGWSLDQSAQNCSEFDLEPSLNHDSFNGNRSLTIKRDTVCTYPDSATQVIKIYPNRNYTFSYYSNNPDNSANGVMRLRFFTYDDATGNEIPILGTEDDLAFYGDCEFEAGAGNLRLDVISNNITPNQWQKHVCQFVSPSNVSSVILSMETGNSDGMTFDALQLEEGEFDTRFVDGVADLEETYLKIAPDEYQCTGNEDEDHPACANFARVCKQTEVGCQGYTDVEDPTAPEIPASLSIKDLCPAVCTGYGEYRKMPSAFDLVQDQLNPEYNDPEDQTIAYFIPSTAQSCTLQDIGCEAFTSMEAATSTGEQVAYYNQLRNCEKPNDLTRTYFTWEGSDTTGYQLKTWALIASSTTDEAPRIILKGALLGSTKNPDTCNEITWKSGVDPDCRQFYDATGNVYYRFYSQTVSSDNSCTLYRKDNSSLADCTKTGGNEYQPQTKSCLYLALPSESLTCSANAGGCRAYLGPTGRNAANVYNQDFNNAESTGWFVNNPNTTVTLSQESVLVGDQSAKLEPTPSTGPIDAEISLPLPSTSTLYRISFWAKSLTSSQEASTVTIDGQQVGSFLPGVIWQRFEFGPFYVKGTATQATNQVQRTCENFNLQETADLRASIEAANPGTEPAQIDLLVADALAASWSNPNQQCTSDVECSLPIQDGGVQIGTAQGTCLFQDVTASVKIHMPANIGVAFIDTMRVDQLNDIRFVRDNSWSTPAVCDATFPEGVPEPRAMLGCRVYNDRDGNTVYARQFGSLCSEDKIGCKAFIDTRDMPTPYPQTITVAGTAGPSTKGNPGANQRPDIEARTYDEQFLGDWSITSQPYRYYYAIDDGRARCDSGEAMCRAFGKPLFNQDRLQLQSTEYAVSPNEALYDTQKQIYSFKTVLLKYDWQSLVDNSGGLKLACRKDELFCDEFKSGNVTEYFRDPGNQTCEWVAAKDLKTDVENGIFSDGTYSGWFRTGTDIPCYRDYLGYGDTYLLQYNGEGRYAGWVAGCPIDQSECTEFVDPNDTSDPSSPSGKSYYLINSNKLDTRSCGATADPLSGCLLFNNKSIPELYANSQATYDKVIENKGQAQTYVDCEGNPEDPNCVSLKRCTDFSAKLNSNNPAAYEQLFEKSKPIRLAQLKEQIKDVPCSSDQECVFSFTDYPNADNPNFGTFTGSCKMTNDSNVVLKVKLDRECARWMGCKTGETVFDQGLQKFVNQCNELEVCQETGKNDDIYCQSLTDRQKEELLKPGEFISLENYSSRDIGFGKMDYSGYTIPNQYVLADIEPRAVGYEILSSKQNNDRYRYDKHLVAHLPMSLPEIEPYSDPLFTEFDLCQDTRTGRIGYQTDGGNYCNFAINEPQSLSLAVGGQGGADDSRDIQKIYESFLADNASRKNSLLQSAMPAPECQLYPEETSPLPGEYVETWNDNVAPPVPEKMVDGYDFATACAYGEDCTCSYRKVRYDGGIERYYSIDGQAPAVGVCVGGDSEGTSCVPGGYVPVNSKNQILVGQKANNTFGTDTQCGTGVCYAIQDVVVMNGKYAYCLERDRTRASGVSQASAPCLTWSPEVVLGGKFDTTHYSPTAGYLPPQGSGEYYCVSGANEQRLETPITEVNQWDTYLHSWTGPYFWSPGKLMQFGYSRADVWWKPSDDDYDNISIDGAHNYVTIVGEDSLDNISAEGQNNVVTGAATKNMRFACRRATVCDGTIFTSGEDRYPANGHSLDATAKEGRWIMTGNSITNSYMEYFIPAGYGISSVNEKYYDYRFGLFKFSLQQSDVGTACKWNPGWAGLDFPAVTQSEGMDFSCESYLQQIQSSSQQFVSKFNADFDGIVDRTSEKLYSTAEGRPIKLKCAIPGQESCYYKYWDTGYNDDNQEKFTWPETVNSNDTEKFNFREQYKSYFAQECRSSQPYFGIRAMFQNVDPKENSLNPEEVENAEFDGPWQFVGFWMTTCMPTSRPSNPGWLYMRMDEVIADVCHEVGQVIAPNTRESAAFADRVWSRGNFLLPVLGLKYSSRHEPSGSALATGKIGSEPMLMGASVPTSGANSTMPTFVDSGTGVAPYLNPQNNWVPLTNLFARVYKIWRWEPSTVTKYDWACVDGPLKGKPCNPWSNAYNGLISCGGYSTCNTDIDPDLKNQNWRCNTLSGVNRGLSCGQQTYPARNTDPICHNAAVAYKENPENLNEPVQTPLYEECNEGYKAAFSVPVNDFGYCWAKIDDSYNIPKAYRFDCEMELSNWADLWDDDVELKFEIIKCTNIDKSFVYPIRASVPAPNGGLQSGDKIIYPMWKYAAYLIESMVAEKVTDLDLDKHTANCADISQISGLFNQIIERNPSIFKGEILDETGPVLHDGEGNAYYPTYDYTKQDKVAELMSQEDYPLGFEMGYWDNDRINPLRINSCGDKAVNPGERCGIVEEESPDCPRKISVCKSGEAEYYPDGTPACSRCNKSDPGDANNRKLYPGTGYCQGFNPLSRCEENSDCVFTDKEFWGAHDNGDATGSNWVDANGELIYYNNDSQFTFDPTPRVPDIRLPTTDLDKGFYFPAMLMNFGSLTSGDNETTLQDGLVLVNTRCPNRAFQYMCEAMFADDPNLIFSSGDESIRSGYEQCMKWCKGSAFLIPNTYAAWFKRLAQDSVSNPKLKYRTAAIAPFAVNPLPRSIKSLSGSAQTPGFYTSGIWHYASWIKGKLFRGNKDDGSFDPLDEEPTLVNIAFPDPFIITNDSFWNFFTNFFGSSDEMFSRLSFATDKDFYQANETFPWDSSRLYFTEIFPLVKESYGNPRHLTDAYYGNQGGVPGYIAFNTIWEGYGISSKLIDLWQAYIDARRQGSSSDVEKAQADYVEQYKVDFEEEYVKNTGWGIFMKPDEPKLQLFPGAVPAAIPAQDNSDPDKDNLYVFLPGHCEPPQGGTDTDTLSGTAMGIMSVAAQGKEDKAYEDFKQGPYLGRPLFKDDIVSQDSLLWASGDASFAPGISPWESYDEAFNNWIYAVGDPVTVDYDQTKVNFSEKGYRTSEVYLHQWTPSYVLQDFNIDAQSIPMEGPVGDIGDLRTTCRCEGGDLDGSVQESEDDCNINLPKTMNAAWMAEQAEKDPTGAYYQYAVNSQILDREYCKPMTVTQEYIDKYGQTYGGPVLTPVIMGNYVGKLVVNSPVPECQASTGNQLSEDPDLDANICTHSPGYIPRGDVCADGRDNCLITYDLSNERSTNHIDRDDKYAPAPSATDVTFGLDTFRYLSGGRTTKDSREYSAWYRPMPPRVAAPDITKSAESSNALRISSLDKFSVEGRPEGLVYYGGGQGLATVQFYAWSAHDQSPIKTVIIDWGDGTVQTIDNAQMKNQKPICNTERECSLVPGLACSSDSDCPPSTGQCLQTGNCKKQTYKTCSKDTDCGNEDVCEFRTFFGNSNEACRQGYFEFSHVYTCRQDEANDIAPCPAQACQNDPDQTCSDCRFDEDCVEGLAPRPGCYNASLNRCRYTPRIMVMDNWGWCTGDCSQQGEVEIGGSSVSIDKLIRHPYGGCLDGSNTKVNTNIYHFAFSTPTLPNECSTDPLTAQNANIYRPWIVYDGSIEVSVSEQ